MLDRVVSTQSPIKELKLEGSELEASLGYSIRSWIKANNKNEVACASHSKSNRSQGVTEEWFLCTVT